MSGKVGGKESKKDTRTRISNYIRLHPGTSFNNIRTIFNLSESTLRYHLGYLEKRGQIKSKPDRRVYFPTAKLSEGDLSKTQQQLIHLIKEHPGITQKDLVHRTRMNRFTVRGNVSALIDKELVTTVRIGRRVHHFYLDPDELRRMKTMRLIALFLLDRIDEETYWDLRRELMKEK